MTYSIIARCSRTGQLGLAVSTSDVAVGARVPGIRSGLGAVVTQHRTDPRLAPRMLDLMERGATAKEAVAGACASTPDASWRQLAAIGMTGEPAAWTGDNVAPEGVSVVLGEHHAVVGNILAGPQVGTAASAAFESDPSAPLGARLMRALEAGLDAGGEPDPLRSAYLCVYGDQTFALADLRVDDHEQPVAELRRLWELYSPAIGEYVRRALTPDDAQGVAPEAESS